MGAYWSYGPVAGLPAEIAGMETLRYLEVRTKGGIPDEIGKATALRTLKLWAAEGAIPGTLGNLRLLDTLRLRGVEGPLPSGMEDMAGLRYLRVLGVGRPHFFDEFLTRMPRLEVLVLGNAAGRVPEGIGHMVALRGLSLTWILSASNRPGASPADAPETDAERAGRSPKTGPGRRGWPYRSLWNA